MRRVSLYILWISLAVTASCVSSGKFQAKVDEAERYQDEVADLLHRARACDTLAANLAAERDTLLAIRKQVEAENTALMAANKELQGALQANVNEKDQIILKLTADRQKLEQDVAGLQSRYDAQRLKAEEALQAEASRMAKLQETYEQLVSGLEEEIAQGQITLDSLAGKLSVNIVDQVLFRSGEALIRKEGRLVLDRVAEVFNQITGQKMVVEGHTDNVPIGEKLRVVYPTNWELSTARATNVVRYLIEQRNVIPELVSVAGYGEYKPVETNTTEEGRARNRRIEILFLPAE